MWSPQGGKFGHRCFGKIRRIFERTGILLTHDEITFLCENLWNCQDAVAFYGKMDSLTTDELKDWAHKAKRKRSGLLQDPVMQSIYA